MVKKESKLFHKIHVAIRRFLGYFLKYSIPLFLFFFVAFYIAASVKKISDKPPVFGVTFSKPYAQSLGFDWKEAYLAMLDDLKAKKLRIPVYWNDIEYEPGKFSFDDYDFMLDELENRNGQVLLAIGRKLPRWPECFEPDFYKGLSEAKIHEKNLSMLEATVDHFKDRESIKAWQVENEALFPFGLCPLPFFRTHYLREEVELVKSLDNRPVMTTDSGEFGDWYRISKYTDLLGISMYRVIWSPWTGQVKYYVNPGFYKVKGAIINFPLDKVYVTELQAEPWGDKHLTILSLDEQFKSFDLNRFKNNVDFAKKSGFKEFYLWGAEWWYYLKEVKGIPSFWNYAKTLF